MKPSTDFLETFPLDKSRRVGLAGPDFQGKSSIWARLEKFSLVMLPESLRARGISQVAAQMLENRDWAGFGRRDLPRTGGEFLKEIS